MGIKERLFKQSKFAIPSYCDYYTKLYRHKKHHSPEISRTSLKRRVKPFIDKLDVKGIVLDVGSGRQIFEREYISSYGIPNCHFVSLDFSEINRRRLLANKFKNVSHIRADGNLLPFRDGSVSIIISNMALDFMDEKAVEELRRVLKPEGRLFLNLCFPALDPENISSANEALKNPRTTEAEKREIEFWKYHVSRNEKLVSSGEEARKLFKKHGFQVEHEEPWEDFMYNWYALDLKKEQFNINNDSVIFSLKKADPILMVPGFSE